MFNEKLVQTVGFRFYRGFMTKQNNQPKKSLLTVLTRIILGLGLLGLLLAVLVPLGAYLYVAKSLPRVDTLADYRPPVITRVLSDDGTVKIAGSRREIIDDAMRRMALLSKVRIYRSDRNES